MTSPPNLMPREGVIPRQGDIAFAVSVSTLYDLTLGLIHWPVWFKKTNTTNPMTPALTLTNAVDGGACLDILNVDYDFEHPVTRFTNRGIHQTHIEGWIDFHYQTDPDDPTAPADPDAPELGSNDIRMYAKDGHLWFKVPGNPTPLMIPFDVPPGPPARFTYWMAGG